MHPSIAPLLQAIDTGEFEDEVDWLEVTRITWTEGDAVLDLKLNRANSPPAGWRVRCHETRCNRFDGSLCRINFEVVEDHVVLLPHSQPHVELYFSSSPADPDALVGQLIEAHRKMVGDWLSPFAYFNASPMHRLSELLGGGFGKLADGPLPLIERYRSVLETAGVRSSTPPARPPVYRKNDSWVEEVGPLFALFMDDSYVVARSFTAEAT